MRIVFAVISGMMLSSSLCLAQEDNAMIDTSSLQSVLSTLKESVEKLSLDNDQLNAKDITIKQQVLELKIQLGQLEAQGDVLNAAASKLQDNNPRRAQQIAQLEEENYNLDKRSREAEGEIKLVQESVDAGYMEDQKLLLDLEGMRNGLPLPSEDHPQKEKLKLMKMIYDSQLRQEALRRSIQELQKNTHLPPAASALAHQQLLKEQIKDLEAQIAAYLPERANSGNADQWDGSQMRQLELELKDLEQNYRQLKGLMDQMSHKATGLRITVSQKVEEAKLQGSIDDLNRQGKGLRADLDDLRSQMVDLDKRKTHLEAMIKQLP